MYYVLARTRIPSPKEFQMAGQPVDQTKTPQRKNRSTKRQDTSDLIVTKPLGGERGKRIYSFLDRQPNTVSVGDFPAAAIELRKGILTETHGGGMVEPGLTVNSRGSYVKDFLQRPMFLPVPRATRHEEEIGDGARTEAVVLQDERQPVSNSTAVPWRAICHLEIQRQSGAKAVGTGWFAGPHTVITAGHCLFDPSNGGYATDVVVVPGRHGNSAPLGYDKAVNMHIHPRWATNRDGAWDLAALTMRDGALGALAGYFDVGVFPDNVLSMHMVNNAGFPFENSKPYGTMWSGFGRIEHVSEDHLYYQIDTSEGQSGSPIFHYDSVSQRRIVLGVHTSYIEFNRAVRISSPVLQWINNLP